MKKKDDLSFMMAKDGGACLLGTLYRQLARDGTGAHKVRERVESARTLPCRRFSDCFDFFFACQCVSGSIASVFWTTESHQIISTRIQCEFLLPRWGREPNKSMISAICYSGEMVRGCRRAYP